ncbi:MAG: lactate utilization protein [Syntrophales bacterium]|jgi:L-lactate utilization protein LutB|nr:lactate utilization protein [Syntrophales bacterium]
MEKAVEIYWQKHLAELKKTLEKNRFEVFVAADAKEAGKIVLEEILPKLAPKSAAWGGSATFTATGLYEVLKNRKDLKVVDQYQKNLTPEQSIEIRRQELLVDLFFTGANAVTEDGQLVNLDGTGNRVAALAFGPKNVIVLAGRNKVMPDLESAMVRVKNFAAPANAIRLEKQTPCAKTAYCEDCSGPGRICNTWTITEKSNPKGRIKVILINEDLGL